MQTGKVAHAEKIVDRAYLHAKAALELLQHLGNSRRKWYDNLGLEDRNISEII